MAFFLVSTELAWWRRAIRGVLALLCNVVYTLISLIYELFITVSRVNILSDTAITPIYQRITMILTIIMTFYITFEFVKYTIQPDTITDKEKGVGNIGLKVLGVIVLIAFVPRIFSLAYTLQNRVIENQIFSKVILDKKNLDFGKLGGEFSANMLSQFYYLDTSEEACKNMSTRCNTANIAVNNNLANLELTGTANILNEINEVAQDGLISLQEDYYKPAIHFSGEGIVPLIVGIFVVYILAMYSIDVGVRYAQLVFLQIIAPIAIIGYLSPKKDNMFQKWVKQCITTYLDLFIRLGVIYFILMLIKILGDGIEAGNLFSNINGGNVSIVMKGFVYVVLVLGLLVFAQRAPKLLSELFPSMGSAGIGMGLDAKKRFDDIGKSIKSVGSTINTAGRTAGAVGGFLVGGIAGRSLKGAIAGAKVGFDKKTKGGRLKNAGYAGRAVLERRRDVKNNGGTVIGSEHRQGHYKNVAQAQDRLKSNMEAYSKAKSNAESSLNNIKFMKELDSARAIAESEGNGAAVALIDKKKSDIKKLGLQYAAGDTSALTTLQVELNNIKTEVARPKGTVVEFHTEENDKIKWNTVRQGVEETAKIAMAVAKNKDDKESSNIVKSTKDSAGNAIFNADGSYTSLSSFAYNMGKVEDSMNNAQTKLINSPEYKRAHENAKGDGSGSSK